MRSTVVAALLAAFLGVAVWPAGDAGAAEGDRWSTDRTNVNVRAGPSTNADILMTIDPGEPLVEIAANGDWYLVALADRSWEGWVFGPLLQRVEDPGGRAVAAIPSPRQPLTPEPTATADFAFGGDPDRGEQVFYKCGGCHTTVRGVHARGPSLVGVVGSRPAHAYGYRYSDGMEAFAAGGAIWDEATLDRFIQRPAWVVKGTAMPFTGIRDPDDRRDLIAYLKQIGS